MRAYYMRPKCVDKISTMLAELVQHVTCLKYVKTSRSRSLAEVARSAGLVAKQGICRSGVVDGAGPDDIITLMQLQTITVVIIINKVYVRYETIPFLPNTVS